MELFVSEVTFRAPQRCPDSSSETKKSKKKSLGDIREERKAEEEKRRQDKRREEKRRQRERREERRREGKGREGKGREEKRREVLFLTRAGG